MIISFEGCIGSGKTTTAQLVAAKLKCRYLPGQALPSSALSRFYSDSAYHAFETELGFLLMHHFQMADVKSELASDLILDFSPGRDLIFARMNLEPLELETFERVYANLASKTPNPMLTIYLDVCLEEIVRRIAIRGRPYEMNMDTDYLKRLIVHYETHLTELGDRVVILQVGPGETRESVTSRAIDLITFARSSFSSGDAKNIIP